MDNEIIKVLLNTNLSIFIILVFLLNKVSKFIKIIEESIKQTEVNTTSIEKIEKKIKLLEKEIENLKAIKNMKVENEKGGKNDK